MRVFQTWTGLPLPTTAVQVLVIMLNLTKSLS